jgi:hypothetical protein
MAVAVVVAPAQQVETPVLPAAPISAEQADQAVHHLLRALLLTTQVVVVVELQLVLEPPQLPVPGAPGAGAPGAPEHLISVRTTAL